MKSSPLRRHTPLRARPPRGRYASQAQRKRLRDQDDCHLCGEPITGDVEIDHIQAWSRGGRTEDDNLAAAHKRCNQARGAMPVEEYRARVRGR